MAHTRPFAYAAESTSPQNSILAQVMNVAEVLSNTLSPGEYLVAEPGTRARTSTDFNVNDFILHAQTPMSERPPKSLLKMQPVITL